MTNRVRTPKNQCPHCQYPINGATNMDDDAPCKPVSGDLSICYKCSGLNVFRDDMTLRKMTDAEFDALTPEERMEVRQVRKQLADFREEIAP